MLLRWPPVAAVRTAVALALAPVIRRRLARADHVGRFAVARGVIPGSLGQIPDELIGFGRHAAAIRPKHICEIGTLHGGTSLFLCAVAPTVRTFAGVDLKLRNSRLVRALAPSDVAVTLIEGSTCDAATRARLSASLDGESLDILFIDGDHTYAGVRSDLLEYRDLVRPGGLIAFHDIVSHRGGADGPVMGLNWSGDVPRLWGELRGKFRSWEFIHDPGQDGFGIGVIEHDPNVTLHHAGM